MVTELLGAENLVVKSVDVVEVVEIPVLATTRIPLRPWYSRCKERRVGARVHLAIDSASSVGVETVCTVRHVALYSRLHTLLSSCQILYFGLWVSSANIFQELLLQPLPWTYQIHGPRWSVV